MKLSAKMVKELKEEKDLPLFFSKNHKRLKIWLMLKILTINNVEMQRVSVRPGTTQKIPYLFFHMHKLLKKHRP